MTRTRARHDQWDQLPVSTARLVITPCSIGSPSLNVKVAPPLRKLVVARIATDWLTTAALHWGIATQWLTSPQTGLLPASHWAIATQRVTSPHTGLLPA